MRLAQSRKALLFTTLVSFLFVLYAATLIPYAKHTIHSHFSGWIARLLTMAVVAVGILPWAHWLRPRIEWCLSLIGKIVLITSYFTILVPFALILRFFKDPFRLTSNESSRWVPKKPLVDTLEAAQVEY